MHVGNGEGTLRARSAPNPRSATLSRQIPGAPKNIFRAAAAGHPASLEPQFVICAPTDRWIHTIRSTGETHRQLARKHRPAEVCRVFVLTLARAGDHKEERTLSAPT